TAWATPDGDTQFRDDIYQRDGLGVRSTAGADSAAPTDVQAARPMRGGEGLFSGDDDSYFEERPR
ncbi:MAG: murein L,D-transpeptidase, partial [Methylocystis sp.]